MPTISEFFGISIYMYYNDHYPAHFHARYGDREALIQISPIAILKSDLPPRAISLVTEWAMINEKKLLEAWKYATEHKKIPKISPLQ